MIERPTTGHRESIPESSPPAKESGVSVVDLSVGYERAEVFGRLSLDVKPREFLTILGPSGCGKTTLLHAIAGLVPPRAGSVSIGGRDITRDRPQNRRIGVVFQQHALFPHMTVARNISYGLRAQRQSKSHIRERMEYLLQLVRLEGFEDRYPRQLSGGQRQRVGLARALAVSPAVLLLDEPLSSLDAKLRKEMRSELRRIQLDVGGTFIMVTHDQEEALAVSDRVAVMSSGRIEQVAEPIDLLKRPSSEFVAEFMGVHNILSTSTKLVGGAGPACLDWHGLPLEVGAVPSNVTTQVDGAAVAIVPHSGVKLSPEKLPGTNCFRGKVEVSLFTGREWKHTVLVENGRRLVAALADSSERQPTRGDEVWVALDASEILLLVQQEHGST